MQQVYHVVPYDTYTVYRLRDPRDNAIRYIGLTSNVFERFKQYLRCDGVNPAKDAWIQKLAWAQVLPAMDSLERIGPWSYALAREASWIEYYLQLGANLFNIAGRPLASTAKPRKAKHTSNERSVPPIPTHVEAWDLADYPVGKRYGRWITVEYATNEEFQSWLEWNKVDTTYVDQCVLGDARGVMDWFGRRCLIINDALDQGRSLELADGTIVSIKQENTPITSTGG
jgi:hypothetical protein